MKPLAPGRTGWQGMAIVGEDVPARRQSPGGARHGGSGRGTRTSAGGLPDILKRYQRPCASGL